MNVRGKHLDLIWKADPALKAPPRFRRACKYRAFVPDAIEGWQPDLKGDLAMVVVDAERRLQMLNSRPANALDPFARLLLRTESVASSRIEGMQADLRSVARAETRREAGANVGPESVEVLANIEAMQIVVENSSAAEKLSVERLRHIHRALLQRVPMRETQAGRIRTEQNWIGGNDFNPCEADFVPPPPDHVEPLLEDLIRFCGESNVPPVVQAAVAHAQFETIHPFADGNGRTGRALVHVVLRRRGITPSYVLPISVVLAANKGRYIAGLESYRDGDASVWIEQFAVSTARAADVAVSYLERVAELQRQWRGMLADSAVPRADAAAWKVIESLPAHPLISIAAAVSATGRTRPAVAHAFEQLVVAAVLTPVSANRRNRVFEAAGLLELLEEVESGVSTVG
ncbi:MAG: Fic family protein [Actinobacteria bacterium]|nr:Fic family protein [Actinomycetota bacterium]